jgi:hypothetical protein
MSEALSEKPNAENYHSFGESACPHPEKFAYTFDKLAEVVEHVLEKTGFHVRQYSQ